MKINEVEQTTGVSKKNIRYYESEGLLHIHRDHNNGYREYCKEDIQTLKRIKLLRKLNVPIATIKDMLEGKQTLQQAMTKHKETLKRQHQDLEEAMDFCAQLSEHTESLQQLEPEEILQNMQKKEEEGVSFVDVSIIDAKKQRIKGALLGAGLFIGFMLLILFLCVLGAQEDPIPQPILITLIAIPSIAIIISVIVLYQRIKYIEGGEEDAYRNY